MRTPLVIVSLAALVALLSWYMLHGSGLAARGLEGGVALEPDARAPASEVAVAAQQEPEPALEVDAERAAIVNASEGPAPAVLRAGFALTGRAFDERRRPVSGARAVLLAPHGAPLEARTDENGRYRIEEVVLPARDTVAAAVLVTTGDGRAGASFVSLWSRASYTKDVHEVTDVVLGSGRSAEVRVTEGGLPAQGARVLLAAGFERLLVGLAETDGQGRARFELVPSGSLHAQAERDGRIGRASVPADAPSGLPLRVELGAARALEVLVVEKGSGAPIAGAELSLEERVMPPRTITRSGDVWTPDQRPVAHAIAPTGADGRTRIEGLPREGELTVSARKAGYHAGRRRTSVTSGRVRAEVTEVRLELEPLTTRSVRVPLVDGELPAPSEVTPLALRPRPGLYMRAPEGFPERGLVRAGEALIEGAPAGTSFGALAETPEGAIADLWCGAEEELGRESSFRRPRTIVVRVEDASGAPVSGAQATARNQAGNPLSEWVVTDSAGSARIGRLFGGLANVHVRRPGDQGWGHAVGAVDLDAGDGELRVVLRPRRELELLVSVDGERRLPARFSMHGAEVVGEDPLRAAVRIAVAEPEDGGALECALSSSETLPAKIALSAAELASGAPVPVALQSAGAILVELLGAPGVRVRLAAQAWNAEAGAWDEKPPHFELQFPNADDGRFRLDRLAPGRYRVREGESGALSEAVEVEPRFGDARVVLDLAGTVNVSGRVVGPDGAELSLARVLVEGLESGPVLDPWAASPGIPANALPTHGEKAHFELNVPAGRPVTLRAWHPLLRAAAEGGSVRVTGAAEELVLRLEAGPTSTFEVPEEAGEGRQARGLRVLLYEGPVGPHPAGEFRALIAEGRARFGGYAPGTYTLWIDPMSGYQPLVLEGVELGEGATELGAPAFTRGSSIRFHIRVPAGQSPPRIFAVAFHRDAPEYRRGLYSNGEAEVVLTGLGAGSFDLSHGTLMDASGRSRRELTLDGEHDELIELEL